METKSSFTPQQRQTIRDIFAQRIGQALLEPAAAQHQNRQAVQTLLEALVALQLI